MRKLSPIYLSKGINPPASSNPNNDLAIQDLLMQDGKAREKKGLIRGNSQAEQPLAQKAHLAIEMVDLNQADSMQLEAIPGIGGKLANRIIKYRTLLGFYVSVEQLRSVYGLSEKNYQRMEPYLRVGNTSGFKKRNINTVYARSLAFYPAIDKKLAEAIIKRRK